MKDRINSGFIKSTFILLIVLLTLVWVGAGYSRTQSINSIDSKLNAILNDKINMLNILHQNGIDTDNAKNIASSSVDTGVSVFISTTGGQVSAASDKMKSYNSIKDFFAVHMAEEKAADVITQMNNNVQTAKLHVADKYIYYMPIGSTNEYIFAVADYSLIEKEFIKSALTTTFLLLVLGAVCGGIISYVYAKNRAEMSSLKKEISVLKSTENEYKIAAGHSNQMLFRFHPEIGSVQLSEEASALQGLPRVIESSPELSIQNGFIDAEYAQLYLDFFKSIKAKKKSSECEILFHFSTGDVWYNMCYTMTNSSDNKPYALISATDITERKLAEAEIIKRSMQDPLTGSLNCKAFEQETIKVLKRESEKTHGMVMLDLDNFKSINDTFGHIMGDNTLYSTCEKLQKTLKDGDLLSRYGGDEFMLLLRDIPTNDSVEIEKRLEALLSASKNEVKNGFYSSASIGFSKYPQDGKTFDELYKTSDSALYSAKKAGRNRFVIFNKNIDKDKRPKQD